MDIPVRMRQIRTNNQNGESQIGLARQARSTSCLADTPQDVPAASPKREVRDATRVIRHNRSACA
jgi:hypothetical protein